MAIEMLTYSQLGERLSCSAEAARALVKRMRLPRRKANDGKVLVSVDLNEINHKPMPAKSLADRHPIIASLKARVETLQSELAKVEALAAGHRADFERERERLDQLMVELLRSTMETQKAKEAVARLEGELAALRSLPWWRRLGRRKTQPHAEPILSPSETRVEQAEPNQLASAAA
jgi:capsule polysaccharide export protein KpsE/RkpR